MFAFIYLILPQVLCAEECTYQSNLISIDTDVSMDEIKDPYRPTFIRLTSPGCPYSPASQVQWEKAASLYPQVNFVTVDSWKNTKIPPLFGKELITPTHALFLANSSQYSEERTISNPPEIQSSPQKFLDLILEQTHLYPIAPPLVSLSPMIIDSFYTAVDDPIILLRDSRCTDQVPFFNEWSRIANEVIFSNGVNPRIGMLDCSLYPDECKRWNHPYAYKTPRALIYSSKNGNYEVIDTYENLNQEKIDGLYANALSRPPKPTPSPVPIPEPDFTLPSTDGYTILENKEFREQRTIESVRDEYKKAFVFPSSACNTADECRPNTLNTPSDCPKIDPSPDDQANSLKIINFFRGLAGLSTNVVKDDQWSQECYNAAINMHKIGKVPSDHIIKNEYATPSYCGEPNNVQVTKDSLLSENAKSVFESSYKLFLDEGAHNNGVVGHRRYLLHPNLNKIGIGFYPYKEDQYDGFKMMRPGVTVIRITKDNSLGYYEESVPENLKFISWPPEGPFPLEHLPSNWHISHKDFRTASLSDLRIFVTRDDNAELKVKQAYLTKTINQDSLVIQMTEEALKRCQLLRTITVTIFNDKLKKIYRFSFDLFDSNPVTDVCLFNTDSSKCPATVTDENKLGPGKYQSSLFSSSTNSIKVYVVEPINLESTKLSFSASTKFFLIGETVEGTVSIGSSTTVDIQNPSKTLFEIMWNVKQKKIGKLETVLTAKSILVNVEEEDETISIYDRTFYTGRQTSFGLSKAIFTGQNNDLYYTIGGVNDNFYVMASSTPAYQEYSVSSDDEFTGGNIIQLFSIFDMCKQKTNKRVIKFYVNNVVKDRPINLSSFIPGRKRDYQFIVVGGNIYFSCDMNISSVANSITFSKSRNNNYVYDFEVYKPSFNANDGRNICPMDFVTINGANHKGDSKSVVIMPYVLGDDSAKTFHSLENFNDLFPAEGAADTDEISTIITGSPKTRCIVTTSGTYSKYKVIYDSENGDTVKRDYNPKTFRPAPGTEDKPISLSLSEVTFGPKPNTPYDPKMYFENYQDLTLEMPVIYSNRNLLGVYNFDNCGKVTFVGNPSNAPSEYEIDTPLVLGNFNYGLTIVAPTVLVTGSKSYDGTWVKAKNMTVSPNLNPTIKNITVVEGFTVDSSTTMLDRCTLNNIQINIKKSQSWWPSISLVGTNINPSSITIDLGIVPSSARLFADSEEYESHSLIIGLDGSTCETIRSKAALLNNGKFALECSSDKTELIAIKGKENAPILSPDDPTGGETTPSTGETVPSGGEGDPSGGEGDPSVDEKTDLSTTSQEEEPVITPEPTPPEEVETVDGNGMTDVELNEAINTKFDELNQKNPDGTNVVIIENKDIIVFDLPLTDKQFIKPMENAKVEYNGGNLHLVLPEKVTVAMSNPTESNLLIKGSGSIDLKIKDSENTESIDLITKSQINGTVSITVPQSVSTFSMNSIELDSESRITVTQKGSDEKVKFTIKEVTTLPDTTATLSDLTIENALKVVQTAVLTIQNVDISKAAINYDIRDFKTFGQPFIKGKFNTLPGSLKLSRASESIKPNENVEYPIVSGDFEDTKCENWYPKISLGGSGFNSKVCLENNPTLDSENKKIVLKYDPSLDKNDNGNKLGPGPIAGIVIAVVVVIAVIIVVVIIVMKRKKNMENSSEVEDGQDNNNEKDDI